MISETRACVIRALWVINGDGTVITSRRFPVAEKHWRRSCSSLSPAPLACPPLPLDAAIAASFLEHVAERADRKRARALAEREELQGRAGRDAGTDALTLLAACFGDDGSSTRLQSGIGDKGARDGGDAVSLSSDAADGLATDARAREDGDASPLRGDGGTAHAIPGGQTHSTNRGGACRNDDMGGEASSCGCGRDRGSAELARWTDAALCDLAEDPVSEFVFLLRVRGAGRFGSSHPDTWRESGSFHARSAARGVEDMGGSGRSGEGGGSGRSGEVAAGRRGGPSGEGREGGDGGGSTGSTDSLAGSLSKAGPGSHPDSTNGTNGEPRGNREDAIGGGVYASQGGLSAARASDEGADILLWPMMSRSLGGRVHILLLPLVTAEQFVRFVTRPVLGIQGKGMPPLGRDGCVDCSSDGCGCYSKGDRGNRDGGTTAVARIDKDSSALSSSEDSVVAAGAGAGEDGDGSRALPGGGDARSVLSPCSPMPLPSRRNDHPMQDSNPAMQSSSPAIQPDASGRNSLADVIHRRLALGTMAACSPVLAELTSVTGGISLLNTLAELLPWEHLDYGTHPGPSSSAIPGTATVGISSSSSTPPLSNPSHPYAGSSSHGGTPLAGSTPGEAPQGVTQPVGFKHGSPAPLPPRGGESGGKKWLSRRDDGRGDSPPVPADGSGPLSPRSLDAIVAAAPPGSSSASSKVMRMAEAAVRPGGGEATDDGPGIDGPWSLYPLADPLLLYNGLLPIGQPPSSFSQESGQQPGILRQGQGVSPRVQVHASLGTPSKVTPSRGSSSSHEQGYGGASLINNGGNDGGPGSWGGWVGPTGGAAGGLDPAQVRALRQHIEAFVASALPFGTPLETHLGAIREVMARGFPAGKLSEQSQRQPAWKPYPYRDGAKQRLSFLVRETVNAAVNMQDPRVTDASVGSVPQGAGPSPSGTSLTSSLTSSFSGLLGDRSMGGVAFAGGSPATAAAAVTGAGSKVSNASSSSSSTAGDVVTVEIAGTVECNALLHGLPDVTAVMQQQRPDFEPAAHWARAIQSGHAGSGHGYSDPSGGAMYLGPPACIVTDLLLHPCVQSSDVRPGPMERVPLCFSPPLGPFCLARYSVPCRSQPLAVAVTSSSSSSSVLSASADRGLLSSLTRSESVGRDQGSPGMGLPLPSPSPPSRISLLSTSPSRASFLSSNPIKSTPLPPTTQQGPPPLALPVGGSYHVDVSPDGDAMVASVQLHLAIWEGFQGTLEELIVELPFPPGFGQMTSQSASVPFGSVGMVSGPAHPGGEPRDALVWKAPGPRNVRAKTAKMSLTASVRFSPARPSVSQGVGQAGAQAGGSTPGSTGQAWGGGGGKGRFLYSSSGGADFSAGGADMAGHREAGRVTGLPAKLAFRLLGKSFTGMSMDVRSIDVYPPTKLAVGPDVTYEVVSGQYMFFSA